MADVYRISIGISLANRVSSVLGLIGRDFIRTQRQAKQFEATLKSIKMQMAVGGALLGAGALGLYGVDRMVRHATEYAHQIALLNTSGMTHLEIVKSIAAAWGNLKDVPTATAANSLAVIRELRMVFRNTPDAIRYAPRVQQAQAVLGSLLGDRADSDAAYTMARAIEAKGGTRTPTEFFKQLNMMTKAMVASGGKITGGDFLSTFRSGRTATLGWNDFFTYTILPTLIQELKNRGGSGGTAGGPGTGLQSAFAAVVGGTISQKALKVWERLGLLDPSKEVFTKTHSLKGVAPGGVRGSDLFQENPFQWVQSILIPAMKAHGFTDQNKMREAIQYLFPNRTAGFLMGQMAMQGWKFTGDVPLIQKASGLEAYQQLLKTDPVLAAQALQAQWNNLMTILGYQILPKLLPVAIKFTDWLSDLSTWLDKHQRAAAALAWGFAGLAAAMAFSGTVLLLAGAFRALGLVLGARGIGGILAGILGRGGGGAAGAGAAARAAAGGGGRGAILAAAGTAAKLTGVGAAGYFGAEFLSTILPKSHFSKAPVLSDQWFVDLVKAGYKKAQTGNFASDPEAKRRNDELMASISKDIKWLGTQLANIKVQMDGKQVAKVVTDHQTNSTRGPTARSPATFNYRQSPDQP